ncbi:hypothetical protein HDU97_001365 [Phlyctochytrium planicorne]|nr:hypothetical protein HDU97_001365 [Phlyctochytrium planicorne]
MTVGETTSISKTEVTLTPADIESAPAVSNEGKVETTIEVNPDDGIPKKKKSTWHTLLRPLSPFSFLLRLIVRHVIPKPLADRFQLAAKLIMHRMISFVESVFSNSEQRRLKFFERLRLSIADKDLDAARILLKSLPPSIRILGRVDSVEIVKARALEKAILQNA